MKFDSHLKQRWKTEKGWKLVEFIRNALSSGAGNDEFRVDTFFQPSNTPEGLFDLRGIPLQVPVMAPNPLEPNPRDIRYFIPCYGDKLWVKNTTIRNTDLSHSTIDWVGWERCNFENVKFIGADMENSSFFDCNFRDVDFSRSTLRYCGFGHNKGAQDCIFENVNFIRSNLTNISCGHPLFSNCDFSNAKLKSITFNGSRFVDCKFAGRIKLVSFYGYYALQLPNEPEGMGKSIRNPMKNVDFMEAIFDDCDFRQEIDLSETKLPKDDNLIVIKNPKEVYTHFRELILNEWHNVEKNNILNHIDSMDLISWYINQPIRVVEKKWYYHILNQKDASEVIELLLRANEEINQ